MNLSTLPWLKKRLGNTLGKYEGLGQEKLVTRRVFVFVMLGRFEMQQCLSSPALTIRSLLKNLRNIMSVWFSNAIPASKFLLSILRIPSSSHCRLRTLVGRSSLVLPHLLLPPMLLLIHLNRILQVVRRETSVWVEIPRPLGILYGANAMRMGN